MKRIITFLVLLFITVPLPVFATSSVPDSLKIGEDTKAQLSLAPQDEVIRVYYGMFLIEFGQGNSLDEAMSNSWPTETAVYFSASEGDAALTIKTIPDNNTDTFRGSYGERFWDLRDDNERIFQPLGDDVAVNKTIYLADLIEHCCIIYYETSIGDYLYLLDFHGKEYLVPRKEFYEMAKQSYDNRTPDGLAPLDQSALAPYSLTNYTANDKSPLVALWWIIPALIIGIAVSLMLICKKKTSITKISPAD